MTAFQGSHLQLSIFYPGMVTRSLTLRLVAVTKIGHLLGPPWRYRRNSNTKFASNQKADDVTSRSTRHLKVHYLHKEAFFWWWGMEWGWVGCGYSETFKAGRKFLEKGRRHLEFVLGLWCRTRVRVPVPRLQFAWCGTLLAIKGKSALGFFFLNL